MALDATVGGAAATSYLTVAAADLLAADDYGPEAEKWLAATTTVAQREQLLKRATREVNDLVRTSDKHTATQRLKFPRLVDVDDADDTFVPSDVQHATYYQAAFLLSNAGNLARADARNARNASSVSEPNMSYTQADDPMSMYSRRALQALVDYQKADSGRGGFLAVDATTGLLDPWSWEVVL